MAHILYINLAFKLDAFFAASSHLVFQKPCPGVQLPQEDAQIVEIGSFRKFLGSTTEAEAAWGKIRREITVLVNSGTAMAAAFHISINHIIHIYIHTCET